MTEREFEETHQQHQTWAEKMDECRRKAAIRASQEGAIAAKTQMDIQKIAAGDKSRAALHQAAAKPKCNRNDCMRDALPGTTGLCPDHYQQYDEQRGVYTTPHPTTDGYTISTITEEGKRYSQILQEPDEHNPWHSHPCAEEGCKMDGHEKYGLLCRDHYYERKHDKRRWVKELPGMATLASIVYVPMFVAGILFGWPYILASWGVLCAGVLGNQTELGLVQGWKRANKPRIPTKGAAKTKPFELPGVEQP